LSSDILVSRDGDKGFIAFNRPHLHNAVSLAMWRAVPKMIESLQAEGARVIVFSGHGDSFASGADLEELRKLDSEESARELWHAILACLEAVWACELPTIAMVHGSCIGGGCLFATSCDFRLASLASSFAVPVTRLGLLLDDRTISRLVAAGGVTFTKELLLAGSTVSAAQAKALGYLHRAVELNKLRFEVMELADQIAGNVAGSLRACKRAINAAAGLPSSNITVSDDAIVASYLTEDFRKRVRPQSPD
jgi:enoyl-CoA hydratase/carnithine racemase